MENSKDNQPNSTETQTKGLVLTHEEKQTLTDFFALLVEIDRKKHITAFYEKQTN